MKTILGYSPRQIEWLYQWYNSFTRFESIPPPTDDNPYRDIIFLKEKWEATGGPLLPPIK